MSKPISLALSVFAVASLAAPANAEMSACQKQLEAAVLKITTSGPMRAVSATTVNGRPTTQTTYLFAPPTDIQVIEQSLLTGDDLLKQQAQIKAMIEKSPGMADMMAGPTTYIGADFYVGSKNQNLSDPERTKRSVYESTLGFSDHTDPLLFIAVSCSPTEIKFEYDTRMRLAKLDVQNQLGEGAAPAWEAVESRRKDIRAEDEARDGAPAAVLFGTLTLDPSGRPVRMTKSEHVPSQAEMKLAMEMAKRMGAGADVPEIKSKSSDTSFTYDPSIKVEVPK
jgi:hypothetical protein